MADVKLKDIDQLDDHPIFRKKLLQRLSVPEQLDQLMVVTPTRAWISIAALALLIVGAVLWGTFARVSSTIDASGLLVEESTNAGLTAVLFVSVPDGQRVETGQIVKLSPSAFRSAENGLLYGYISSISTRPADRNRMIEVLGNDALAQSLIAQGLIIETRVALIADDTPSGFLWTTKDGPAGILFADTPVVGKVVVDQDRPIELVWSTQ